ncbi:MAG: TonB-dependent receptor [Bacteroidia bacterium]|nr:TonB-dependent receptor [Bacteroidia bacterium]
MKITWALLGLILFSGTLYGQQKYTVSGYVKDASSGEWLIGAKVYDVKSLKGAITNDFGFFSLTLETNQLDLRVSYVGYQSYQLPLMLEQDIVLTFELEYLQLDEVEIVAEDVENIAQQTEMSSIDVPIEQIKMLPALLGEVDVIKAIQLLPGVQSGNEGSSGLYVRGGGPDQNLILLDDVPLYYVSHLGGFFSVFNADALSNVRMVKGGFPARYGGRISSVLDIRMKEGNNQNYQVEGSLGLLASKISVQGPIIKNKTSFIVSGRRTYFDLFTRPLTALLSSVGNEGGSGSFGYLFYDFNAKVNHIISDKDRLYFSTYLGDDRLGLTVRDEQGQIGDPNYSNLELKSKNGWGNQMAALRWNHLWSPKLFSNLTGTYTNYRLLLDNTVTSTVAIQPNNELFNTNFAFRYFSGIRDFGARWDFDFYPNPDHDVEFGVMSTFHIFTPGAIGLNLGFGDSTWVDTTINNELARALETSIYLEDQWKIGSRISANLGAHFAHYLINQKNYFSLQPRISARYLLTDKWSVKASYTRMTQFLHLLVNSTTGLPVDLWVPATENVAPQQAWQTAAGIAGTIFNGLIDVTVEGYYKEMTGLISYKEGVNLYLGVEGSWEDRVETDGLGKAYGAEVLFQKKRGKTTGWVGYTLSWNTRQFENLNNGNPFPFRYDRRHDASVVIAHKFNDRISLSGTWVYGTGNAITLPSGGYATASNPSWNQSNFPFFQLGGAQLYENGRNGFRMEAYHRADIGINFTKQTRWGERTWNISFYNLYSRLNPYFYYIGQEDVPGSQFETQPALKKISLFPIIPSVSYSFKVK